MDTTIAIKVDSSHIRAVLDVLESFGNNLIADVKKARENLERIGEGNEQENKDEKQ